jgi:rRNA maturation endonuclease Nob1
MREIRPETTNYGGEEMIRKMFYCHDCKITFEVLNNRPDDEKPCPMCGKNHKREIYYNMRRRR